MQKLKSLEAHYNKEMKNAEIQYTKDINNLRNVIFQKNEESEKIVEKYENKIILVILILFS